jgi:hypothetical protein
MIISKKSISRRAVLRGMGATVALPLLDAMVPALTAAPPPAIRFGAIYVPNGIGLMKENWTPRTEGASFEFPRTLKPLESYRDRLLVLSGLNSTPPPETPDDGSHPRASTRYLTNMPPKFTRGVAGLQAGISIDQILAKETGRRTQLASLELGLESSEAAGTCGDGFSCAYSSTISWAGPTTPLPMEYDPRAAFERMFGDSGTTSPAVRQARIQEDGSILDSIIEKVTGLERGLGAGDRGKLREYLASIRDIERRIQVAEDQSSRELPLAEQPAGVPDRFADHAKLMYDLFALAYQADLTRVVTFQFCREQTGRTYPELNIAEAHHHLSHHGNDPEKNEKLVRINTYQAELFAAFLEKLRSPPDGDGNLLDHVMIVYGAGMSDGNRHDPKNLPILLVGGGGGQIRGGRHLRFATDTPLGNLHLTLADKFGVHLEKMGYDSTGRLDGI